MFEAVISDASIFKRTIAILKDFAPETNVLVTPTGISLRAIDDAQTGMYDTFFQEQYFQDYLFEKPQSFRLNLISLNELLLAASYKDYIRIRIADDASELNLHFYHGDDPRAGEFTLTLSGGAVDDIIIPKSGYHATIEVGTNHIGGIVRDLRKVGKLVTVELENGKATFSTTGITCRGVLSLTGNEPDGYIYKGAIIIKADKKTCQTFSLLPLARITMAESLTEVMTLSMAADAYAKLEYTIPGAAYIHFYLIPQEDSQR